jgi:hypothetical protein
MRRLILFDIDGTLVRGGPAKTAFLGAMAETYGTTGDPESVSFGGKTDPQIAREILSGAGLDHAAIDEGFPTLWERYLERLEPALETHPMTVLPGVPELLEGLAMMDGVALGLVTGNIVGGAKLKGGQRSDGGGRSSPPTRSSWATHRGTSLAAAPARSARSPWLPAPMARRRWSPRAPTTCSGTFRPPSR